jgi:dUTP pyrophosphatase
MAKFEKITKYKEDADLAMPTRKTELSAGYDMVSAEDCVIPSIWTLMEDAKNRFEIEEDEYITTSMMAEFTKATGIKPTLVPTGMKCQLEPGTFLQLSVRSSSPLKYWIMMANGVGVIDADYFDNPGNEGHIFFQLYNLSPFNIQIKKGEAIGQGIIIPYATTENDNADGERVGGFGSTGK